LIVDRVEAVEALKEEPKSEDTALNRARLPTKTTAKTCWSSGEQSLFTAEQAAGCHTDLPSTK